MSLNTIPDFETEKEEHDFWITHSSADYEMEAVSESIRFEPNAKTEEIHLRLPRWLMDDLKAIAAYEGVPYQRLIKNCLKAFVATRKQTIDDGSLT